MAGKSFVIRNYGATRQFPIFGNHIFIKHDGAIVVEDEEHAEEFRKFKDVSVLAQHIELPNPKRMQVAIAETEEQISAPVVTDENKSQEESSEKTEPEFEEADDEPAEPEAPVYENLPMKALRLIAKERGIKLPIAVKRSELIATLRST